MSITKNPPLPSIAELVPHQRLMLLLDHLIDYGEDYVITATTITPQSLLYQGNGVPGWLGIEYMAQSVAAYGGIQSKQQQRSVQVGFLLGTRRYESLTQTFSLGSELHIRAQVKMQDDSGLGVFDCSITENQQLVAKATLNVFQPKQLTDYQQ